MDVGTKHQNLTMMTPINGSHQLTFGVKSKMVNVECIHPTWLSRGIWYGDNPLEFAEPVFLMQLILGCVLTNFCQLLFRPLGQTSIVGQIMAGFVAGPTVLGRSKIIKEKLFPPPSAYVQETMSLSTIIFIFFLAGVRMDIGTIRNSGKKEWAIGVLTFVLPMLLSVPAAFIIREFVSHKDEIYQSIGVVAFLGSASSFNVVATFLHELNLLNSELGRLAMSSSMISGLISWITLDISMAIKQTVLNGDGVGVFFELMGSTVILGMVLFFGVRPFMLWIIRHTEEGRPIKQSYLCSIFIIILACCFISESLGKHVAFTAAFVGLCVPGGPPLGSALEEKINCFVTAVLLPLYLIVNFSSADLSHLTARDFFILEFIYLLSTLGKFMGTVVPCFYCDIPFSESVPLGLALCTDGLIDLQFYKSAELLGYFSGLTFGVMSLSMVMVTGVVAPVVRVMYNPSRKYISYKRRTLQHHKRHSELPILVCVYNQENVPALINLLDATHPIKDHPMAIYLLQLVELVGRAAPLLIAYQTEKRSGGSQRSGSAVVNAFKIFQRNNPGVNIMQPYTSIAPYATMHDDICTLALDKRVCFIIVPFHKQWHFDGVIESVSWRNVNQNLLMRAPCSVGILIDRGALNGLRSISESWTYFRVAMIFLGGVDDREALSLAMRMAQHPNVNLTVIRLVPIGDISEDVCVLQRMLDEDVITDFRLATVNSRDRVLYTEEGVTDGIGTINVIRSIDNLYDLILIGRRHDKDSPFLEGSMEWGESPDIGFVGDILTSTDFKRRVSILVVQQHDLTYQPNLLNPILHHLDSLNL